uniref:hypothetical protein n=1 Tax=Streptococcus mitis TaxID=28037 RepID=UPI0021B5A100
SWAEGGNDVRGSIQKEITLMGTGCGKLTRINERLKGRQILSIWEAADRYIAGLSQSQTGQA